jgi:hypothetical protein
MRRTDSRSGHTHGADRPKERISLKSGQPLRANAPPLRRFDTKEYLLEVKSNFRPLFTLLKDEIGRARAESSRLIASSVPPSAAQPQVTLLTRCSRYTLA